MIVPQLFSVKEVPLFNVHKSLSKVRKVRGPITDFGPSLAVQSDKERTDIRNIVKRAMRTGGMVSVNYREGEFKDISDAPSFMQALGLVAQANEMFSRLPASVRDRFSNDPSKMLAFLDDDANKAEAIKLGLRNPDPDPPAPPEPISVRVVGDPPPKPASS